jgi:thiomorpholine-carboxylate dehydrogenase
MYLDEEQVRAHISYERLIPAIRLALVDYSAGRVDQPLRSVLPVKDHEGRPSGWFAAMPVVAGDYLAIKSVTFFPANAELAGRSLATHLATIELRDRTTGEPLAVMDGRLITEMRTAAVSAVAVEALAPPKARTLGMLGSGVQARSHIEALRVVCPAFREPGSIRVWSRNPQNAAALADEIGATAVGIEEAAGCDVVVVATSATEPVLLGRWLGAEALVVAVGAVGPRLRELDDDVMRGWLIAESRQGAENESGDVLLSGARVYAELGEILSGAVPPPPDGRRVFKSVGMAIEDLASAALVWEAVKQPPARSS